MSTNHKQFQHHENLNRIASNTSSGSNKSSGIGTSLDILNRTNRQRKDLSPNLTPEGLSINPSVKIYDAIVYLIYCDEHDKIAVTNVERARCVWFPFVYLPENQTWMQAAKNGLDLIIGRKDAEMDAAESAKQAPLYSIGFLNVLRIQLPLEKYITRLAMIVCLKKSPNSSFQCCQRSMRINWIRASDILTDRIDKIWGPELKNFTKMSQELASDPNDDQKIAKPRTLITEFSLQNSFYHYMVENNSPEKKLLQASHIKPEHIAEIYENFVEHCYPSFYMSYESFKFYLIKYGFGHHDERLPFLFRAFSLYNNDFLHFHEVLLGLIAMEPSAKHLTEGRLNFIFRYYDTSNNGYLKLDEFIVMVTDIQRYKPKTSSETLSENRLKAKIENAIRCVGMKNERISKDNFIKAVLSDSFQHTEYLCRSPKPILTQISRLMQARLEEKSKSLTDRLSTHSRSKRGNCIRCREQNYSYCLHCVTFDTSGRCVKPTIISEQWIEPVSESGMNSHKYSIEYVFNTSSVPNIFIDLIKDFYNKTKFQDNTQSGLMSLKEDWTIFSKYISILCEQLKGLLLAEDKLIKINAPSIIVGDLQGSLSDLFAIEQNFFQSFPVSEYNLVFLGNYSGLFSKGIEVITYLFSMKLLSPNKVFLLRGTNEILSKSKLILKKECLHKYGQEFGRNIFNVVQEIFDRLPFAIIVDESIFCCHSGIPKWNKIDKLVHLPHDISSVIKEAPIAYEMIVNTPYGLDDCLCSLNKEISKVSSQSRSSRIKAKRKLKVNSVVGITGITPSDHCDYLNSCSFDQKAFNNFMRSNCLQFMIRSHSLMTSSSKNGKDTRYGFDFRFDNRLITIFSCSKPNSIKCTIAMLDGFDRKIRIIEIETEAETDRRNINQTSTTSTNINKD
ncbi:Serine/threonine-protein phosphatase PP-X -like protein 2 [Sarcoptes scabiei]|uniref:Serine/threonine-protein phosphatase PP-X -like protein 2 n=1 Tax=Sarcoptes scabiei TaxID=52283 RepID=A0A834R2N7_SARSC|nr:Serine/threonine-protein phosphatase PP-X -like protein 2 [Sarcoptes scabiei]